MLLLIGVGSSSCADAGRRAGRGFSFGKSRARLLDENANGDRRRRGRLRRAKEDVAELVDF